MAGRAVRLVAYVPSLRSAAKQFRAASSTYASQQVQPGATTNSDESVPTVWPDQVLGVLAPHDRRFPLPGLTGAEHQLSAGSRSGVLAGTQRRTPGAGAAAATAAASSFDDLTALLPSDRHAAVAEQLISAADDEASDAAIGSALHKVECVIQDCPDLLKKRIAPLFPSKNVAAENLTVITLSQKTDNDMTGWNPDVEEEREALLAEFVEAAQEICKALSEAGYWADFIDPSSGKPFVSAPTNDTLFETDDRYRYFGFEIEDLGCCKVILHHKWGSKCYVGSVFTDAPSTDPVLNEALGLFKK